MFKNYNQIGPATHDLVGSSSLDIIENSCLPRVISVIFCPICKSVKK